MQLISEVEIRLAAEALLRGELVVMPTETVYGLACDATNPGAVRKVFEAKERPAENPLIVHIASAAQVLDVATEFPEEAKKLADCFWPGPLTLVLPKRPEIPDEVTAGLRTVAVRVPSHPVAHRLLEVVCRPIAAPSANRFMHLSPTRAQDVEPEIATKASFVLDGGQAVVGIESTVVDCSGPIRILRPGGVSRRQVERCLGHALEDGTLGSERRSPGLYARHYAPKTPVRLVAKLGPDDPGLTFDTPCSSQIHMPSDAEAYAAQLYRSLAQMDLMNVAAILVEAPPQTPEWEAVWDRLRKAASR